MIVTSIIPLDKKRSRVYIDREFAFVLYKGELIKYKIKEDADISEELYGEIVNVILVKRAKLRAMNLLTKRDYSEKSLRDKLAQGEYPMQVIEQAVSYVKSFGYIDDQRYAAMYYRTYQSNKPLGKICSELLGKGISKEIIEELKGEISGHYEEDSGDAELEMALQLLKKRNYEAVSADYKAKQRMYGFLMRKGFSGDTICKALNCSEMNELV